MNVTSSFPLSVAVSGDTERPGHVRNVHFRDLMENGQMTFDYRLKEGIVTTTNALEVLRSVGIIVRSDPAEGVEGS